SSFEFLTAIAILSRTHRDIKSFPFDDEESAYSIVQWQAAKRFRNCYLFYNSFYFFFYVESLVSFIPLRYEGKNVKKSRNQNGGYGVHWECMAREQSGRRLTAWSAPLRSEPPISSPDTSNSTEISVIDCTTGQQPLCAEYKRVETFRERKDDASARRDRAGDRSLEKRRDEGISDDRRSRRGVSLAPRLRRAASFCLHPAVTGANRTPRTGGEYRVGWQKRELVGIWSAPSPREFHAYPLSPPHCTPTRTLRASRHDDVAPLPSSGRFGSAVQTHPARRRPPSPWQNKISNSRAV
ncbi:hypothetical protein ALC62_00969, partial [Cyphomyrmex costatus]